MEKIVQYTIATRFCSFKHESANIAMLAKIILSSSMLKQWLGEHVYLKLTQKV